AQNYVALAAVDLLQGRDHLIVDAGLERVIAARKIFEPKSAGIVAAGKAPFVVSGRLTLHAQIDLLDAASVGVDHHSGNLLPCLFGNDLDAIAARFFPFEVKHNIPDGAAQRRPKHDGALLGIGLEGDETIG